MRSKEDLRLKELLEQELQKRFVEDREELRVEAKTQILKTQNENQRSYNLRRRKPNNYKLNDLVAIKRTQMAE